jgi:hypothetical protein
MIVCADALAEVANVAAEVRVPVSGILVAAQRVAITQPSRPVRRIGVLSAGDPVTPEELRNDLAPLRDLGCVELAVGVMLVCGLSACAPSPTQEECKAAITRTLEIQIDELDAPGSPTAALRKELTEEQRKESAATLKQQANSLPTPAAVDQCVARMKRADIQCTMSATTTDELVQKCHWKRGVGAKGSTLGF